MIFHYRQSRTENNYLFLKKYFYDKLVPKLVTLNDIMAVILRKSVAPGANLNYVKVVKAGLRQKI